MKLCVAFDKVPVLKLQVPLAFAVAVPSLIVPPNSATLLLAAAVPLRVNDVALVMPSPAVPAIGR